MKKVFLTTLMLLLAACGKPTVQCSNEAAQAPVVSIVKEQVEKAIANQTRDESGVRAVSLSKIRAAVNQLSIVIADVRTSKEDPNSTKKFCSGSLRIRIPSKTIEDADAAREIAKKPSVSQLADSNNVEQQADSFSADIEFNVQPTDDGSKVFAQTESGENIFSVTAEILSSDLLKSALENGQRETQLSQQQQKTAETAAQEESRQAAFVMAKTENQLAFQTINAVWRSIPSSTRQQLLMLQRAWGRKKDADCNVEASAASVNPTEIATARLTCDTRISKERTDWLQQYRADVTQNGSAPATAPAPEQPASDL